MNALPKHLSFIMDGNGRWATRRGLPRKEGHVRGYRRMLEVIDFCLKKGIPEVSFFAFSTDNLKKRDESERNGIYSLALAFVSKMTERYLSQGVRIHFFGDLETLPEDVKNAAKRANDATAENDKLLVGIALNYGGKEDIAQAMKCDDPETALRTFPLSPIDLLVRTGGEKRLSNFALWLLAYSELTFSDELWPDVDEVFLNGILDDYMKRDRRFGGYGE